MKSQKVAVVEIVLGELPGFQSGKDVALNMLSSDQLERIKLQVARDIEAGVIEYGKDKNNWSEVRPYARSMVMNHLKKAKELNGGYALAKSSAPAVRAATSKKTLQDINMDILTDDLKAIVETLVE